MIQEMPVVKAAAKQFAQNLLRPADRIGVVGFNQTSFWLTGFTNDFNAVAAAVDKVRPGGETHLFDTTIEMLFELQRAGIEIRDCQQVMLEARELKSIDEIMLLNTASAMVDGVYHMLWEKLKPGVRESDLVAEAKSVQVAYDYDRREPVPLPADWREKLTAIAA